MVDPLVGPPRLGAFMEGFAERVLEKIERLARAVERAVRAGAALAAAAVAAIFEVIPS